MADEIIETNRPSGIIGWIMSHPKMSITLFVLLFLLLSVLVADKAMGNRFQAKIAAIRARGEPTCVEDLNAAPHRIADSDNVLPKILVEAAAIKATKISDDINKNLPIQGLAIMPPVGCRWPKEQQNAAHPYLDSIKDQIAKIRALLAKGKCELNNEFASPMMESLFSEFSDLRCAVKALSLEAQTAADDGDCDRAMRLLAENFAMTNWNGPNPWVISCLTEMACDALLQNSINEVLNKCSIQDEALARLQNNLISIESGPDMRRAFMVERVGFIDTAQWVRNHKQLPGFFSTGRTSFNSIPVIIQLDVAEGLDCYSGWVRETDKPDIRSINRLKQLDAGGSFSAYCYLSKMMSPSLARAVVLWTNCVAQNRSLQVAIAAERYRLAHRKWPTKLDDLVPSFLEKVPIDPFDEKPIRYAVWTDGIKVWSVGENLSDNGGDVPRLEPYDPKSNKHALDSGWVILNPDLRGRPLPVATTQKSKP